MRRHTVKTPAEQFPEWILTLRTQYGEHHLNEDGYFEYEYKISGRSKCVADLKDAFRLFGSDPDPKLPNFLTKGNGGYKELMPLLVHCRETYFKDFYTKCDSVTEALTHAEEIVFNCDEDKFDFHGEDMATRFQWLKELVSVMYIDADSSLFLQYPWCKANPMEIHFSSTRSKTLEETFNQLVYEVALTAGTLEGCVDEISVLRKQLGKAINLKKQLGKAIKVNASAVAKKKSQHHRKSRKKKSAEPVVEEAKINTAELDAKGTAELKQQVIELKQQLEAAKQLTSNPTERALEGLKKAVADVLAAGDETRALQTKLDKATSHGVSQEEELTTARQKLTEALAANTQLQKEAQQARVLADMFCQELSTVEQRGNQLRKLLKRSGPNCALVGAQTTSVGQNAPVASGSEQPSPKRQKRNAT